MSLQVRQLFEHSSHTYTYLVFDAVSKEALIVDPVKETLSRDLEIINELGLNLKFICDTHIHADHITSSGLLRQQLGAEIAIGKDSKLPTADRLLNDGDTLKLGACTIHCMLTPGHTSGCTSYWADGFVFTGDTLLIRGCGRTDFQEGDSGKLFESVREKLFTLPDATIVYPGHDYKGRTTSTIAEEKELNPRLNLNLQKSDFQAIMAQLELSPPQKIDVAVPANLKSGL